ncbi:hypothetical protein RclHR1_03220015 [Rhizophagus clarus]|uniref:Protein NBR1 homolog n=1 Tax=Rhizophagus clarus TaxID=94130 RepID=A0A2Z6RBP6_9GLOM|nr:hypothetical protein RclHR1_03220015 [Rhizophagus clarus]GES93990.1 protein NBR1 homolog [Rhizophagus clarus]
MAIIKVTYNSISRRFNITSPNWAELESKLRSLYNIPATSSLIVSYSDEDGDIITLSSDLELKEILDQQTTSRPIKLILSTVDNESENLIIEDENDNVVVNKSSTVNNPIEDFSSLQQNQQQTTELEEENVGSRSPSYQHVTLEEEEEPEDDQSTLLDKEKEKKSEQQRPENTNENKSQPENENKKNDEEDDDDDEIIFIISYPWARQPFFGPRFGHGFGPRFGHGFGPRFGFFGGPRFGLFDELFSGPRHYPFSPFNFYERPQCDYRSACFNGYGWPSANFSSRQCGPNACNGNSKPSCCSKQQRSDFSNKNAEASTSASAKTNRCNKDKYTHSSRFSCGRNSNFFHPQYCKQTTFTQEQLNEKLSILYSMGFDSSNNTLYEDLIKRYNGNLERVIELLLRNQQVNDYYDNDKSFTSESKRNGIEINEAKSNNDEIKQVDNEESKPYNL